MRPDGRLMRVRFASSPERCIAMVKHTNSPHRRVVEPCGNAGDGILIKRAIKVFGHIPNVRCCKDVPQSAEGMLYRQRFLVEHVERGSRYRMRLKDFDQRCLI